VARNRKRAKERRARRPQPIATARRDREEATPGPIGHAAPDVELAEAQMAVGRPELSADDESAPDEESFDLEAGAQASGGDLNGEGLPPSRGGGELAIPAGAGPVGAPRPWVGNRLINFLQGSWRELQRVQWPDRRQVIQATGVVIGFVIVAGVFLGVADFLAGKLMNYILK
jgi:preprotein translocase subunit SecE